MDWLEEELLDSDTCSGVQPGDLAESESIDWLLEALQGSGVPPDLTVPPLSHLHLFAREVYDGLSLWYMWLVQ